MIEEREIMREINDLNYLAYYTNNDNFGYKEITLHHPNKEFDILFLRHGEDIHIMLKQGDKIIMSKHYNFYAPDQLYEDLKELNDKGKLDEFDNAKFRVLSIQRELPINVSKDMTDEDINNVKDYINSHSDTGNMTCEYLPEKSLITNSLAKIDMKLNGIEVTMVANMK